MAPDKLTPNDPRVQSLTAAVRGKTYHYLLGKPAGRHAATVLLVHGFPDCAFGWRYQVPMLLSLGLQVIVPDALGYGGTDAPPDVAAYSFKSVSADLAELAAQVCPGERVILGGHDWGGYLVWRMALWHRDLVRAVFCVCAHYIPPAARFQELGAVARRTPALWYQTQLAGPDVERAVAGPERTRQFLRALYGGRTPDGEAAFTTEAGCDLDKLDRVGPSPLVSEAEMGHYVEQYARTGMRGPLNWYRTREVNFREELPLLGGRGRDGANPAIRFAVPSMRISATRDIPLPPALTEGMPRFFDDLTERRVEAGHWALWQVPEQVNGHIKEFVGRVLDGKPIRPSI